MARPKGSKNRRNLEVEAIAARFKVNPFEVLMRISAGDWKWLGYERATRTVFAGDTSYDVENIPIATRCQAAKEAAKYLYAQKQSIQHTTGDEGFRIVIEDYTSK